MILRVPVAGKKERRLHILIYARYSTDEQRRSSIDDQVDFCRRILAESGVCDVSIEVLYDAKMSGELRDRPGINDVRRGIESRRWDLILCEDSSRLFRTRNRSQPGGFFFLKLIWT